jgi:hypothetical protein
MENSIFSPTSLVLVAGNTQSLIQFCHGQLGSPDETESGTAHLTELATPCKPSSHSNLSDIRLLTIRNDSGGGIDAATINRLAQEVCS